MSVISARVPTRDQLVGVADLRLCDGDKWKESVKVCFELFSTAAASDRVAPEMQRNSVQGNSCSYGSVEFRFLEVYITIAMLADAYMPASHYVFKVCSYKPIQRYLHP